MLLGNRSRRVWRAACTALALAVAIGSASAKATPPPPWGARCEARIRALLPRLAPLGKATLVTKAGVVAGPLGGRDRFGTVTLKVARKAGGTWVASVGDDHSGRRHRDPVGLHEKRYEVWHSAHDDALDGDPTPGEVRDELHHRVAVGVLRAEVRGARGTTATPSEADLGAFQAAVTPALEACLADVLPLEGDPSLGWTTECLAMLGGGYVFAAALAPRLAGGRCRRAPYEAACGRLDGRPTFNALLLLGGSPADARATWTSDARDAQRLRLGDSAMIWAHQASDAEWSALRTAFEAPLAACVARAWSARTR